MYIYTSGGYTIIDFQFCRKRKGIVGSAVVVILQPFRLCVFYLLSIRDTLITSCHHSYNNNILPANI